MKTISIPLLGALSLLLSLAACDQAGAPRTDALHVKRQAVEGTRTMGAAPAVPEKAVDAAGEVATRTPDQVRIDDALIAAKVTTGLAADKNLSALKIKVDAHGGVVTLRGPAPSAAVRARAEEIARNVQGVTSVNNQLDIQAG